MRIFIKYKLFLILVLLNIGLLFVYPQLGKKPLFLTAGNLWDMVLLLPAIFILLGLLDVWVEREIMIRVMGQNSGILGVLIAYLLGSAAAGPLYAAFPVAGVLLKKGCNFFNVLIFMGAWSTTKIPLLLFESSSMGIDFMLLRLLLDIPGIALIALITNWALNKKEKEEIYQTSKNL